MMEIWWISSISSWYHYVHCSVYAHAVANNYWVYWNLIAMPNFIRSVTSDCAKPIYVFCEGKWGLTSEQILEWANRWSLHKQDIKNFIPKFQLAKENKPDIVVVLNGNRYYYNMFAIGVKYHYIKKNVINFRKRRKLHQIWKIPS